MAKNQKSYTPEFKQQIVDLYNAGGTSYPQLEREYGVNRSTLSNWVKQLSPIKVSEEETVTNYAYAAQFGVWHTGGSLNTEFKLTVKLYFLDGTSGVYLVNTDASESSNTFYGLKLGVDEAVAENYRDILNEIGRAHV